MNVIIKFSNGDQGGYQATRYTLNPIGAEGFALIEGRGKETYINLANVREICVKKGGTQ